jgi:phosphoribosyl-AMP cyclohydrolase
VVEIDFEKGKGLLPVIVQDYETGEVLMLAYMNRKAWLETLETGKATYWSRSRNELWVKGETSGHVQIVKEILVDCDSDTLLLKVHQVGGAACHTGYKSCFFRKVTNGKTEIIGKPVFKPEDVYK